MRPARPGEPPGASAEPPKPFRNPLATVQRFFYKTVVVAELEGRKLWHDPTEVLTRAVQPVLWLLVFGQVMNRLRAIDTGERPYIDFMSPASWRRACSSSPSSAGCPSSGSATWE